MRSEVFYFTLVVIVVVADCYMNQERLSPVLHRIFKNQPSSSSRFHGEYDSDNDVKTVDILSLETIRSTLVRQGKFLSIYFIALS